MDVQKIGKKGVVTAVVAISMLVGAAGATVLKTNAANAQTPTTAPAASNTPSQATTSPGSGSVGTQGSTFKSNEDPAHEAKESAQWEAQENAGQAPWQHQSANGSQ